MHFKHNPGFDKKYSLIILFSHQVETKLMKTKLIQAALDRAWNIVNYCFLKQQRGLLVDK